MNPFMKPSIHTIVLKLLVFDLSISNIRGGELPPLTASLNQTAFCRARASEQRGAKATMNSAYVFIPMN
jgi:hypothetical protein